MAQRNQQGHHHHHYPPLLRTLTNILYTGLNWTGLEYSRHQLLFLHCLCALPVCCRLLRPVILLLLRLLLWSTTLASFPIQVSMIRPRLGAGSYEITESAVGLIFQHQLVTPHYFGVVRTFARSYMPTYLHTYNRSRSTEDKEKEKERRRGQSNPREGSQRFFSLPRLTANQDSLTVCQLSPFH